MLQPWDPLGYKVAHFRQARKYTVASSQQAGPLWEFRWGSALGLCFVTRITLKGIQNLNMTAQEFGFSCFLARSFTAADPTNTASILRAGNFQKLNTAFPASILSEFRESNSATAATAGTYTKDTDPICTGGYSTVATPTVDGSADLVFDFQPEVDGDQLLRLNKNEGFIINMDLANSSAVAGFITYLEVCWVEATKPTTTVGGL